MIRTTEKRVRVVVSAFAARLGADVAPVFRGDRTPEAVVKARHLSVLVCWRVLGLPVSAVAEAFRLKPSGVEYGATRAGQLLVSDHTMYAIAIDVLKELGVERSSWPILTHAVPGRPTDPHGLVAVHDNTISELGFFDRVPHARCFEMALTSGSHVVEALRPKLKEAILNGCHVRIALANHKHLEQPADVYGGQSPLPLLEWTFNELRSLKMSLEVAAPSNEVGGKATEIHGSLAVGTRSTPPTCNLLLVDGSLARWTPLLPYEDTKASPSLDFMKGDGSIYPALEKSFRTIWRHAHPLPEFDFNEPPFPAGKEITSTDAGAPAAD